MTPEQFSTAVSIMQERGVIPAGHGWKVALAAKLGTSRPTIDRYEAEGTKQIQTDYAIAAIIEGVSLERALASGVEGG